MTHKLVVILYLKVLDKTQALSITISKLKAEVLLDNIITRKASI